MSWIQFRSDPIKICSNLHWVHFKWDPIYIGYNFHWAFRVRYSHHITRVRVHIDVDFHEWQSLILMASKTDTEVNKTKFDLETKPSSESGPACPLLFSLAEGSSILKACDLYIKMGVRYLERMTCNESVIRRYTSRAEEYFSLTGRQLDGI